MIVMRVRFDSVRADAVVVATSTAPSTTSAASIPRFVRFMQLPSCGVLQGNFVSAAGPPRDEPVLERGDQELRDERDDGEDEHRRKDGIRVERSLGERNEVAQA